MAYNPVLGRQDGWKVVGADVDEVTPSFLVPANRGLGSNVAFGLLGNADRLPTYIKTVSINDTILGALGLDYGDIEPGDIIVVQPGGTFETDGLVGSPVLVNSSGGFKYSDASGGLVTVTWSGIPADEGDYMVQLYNDITDAGFELGIVVKNAEYGFAKTLLGRSYFLDVAILKPGAIYFLGAPYDNTNKGLFDVKVSDVNVFENGIIKASTANSFGLSVGASDTKARLFYFNGDGIGKTSGVFSQFNMLAVKF